MSNAMPFESQVANTAHEQWLYSEVQKMLQTKGLGAENLCTWQGSVYGAFDIESDDIYERAEQDWGLSQLGENGEQELPSLILQSCWANEYKHMFNEMQEWMQRGAGAVQMAILLKWILEVPEPGANTVLHSEIEVFEYVPKTEARYKRTFHEKVSSTEERELKSVKITTKQLFAGLKPRGRGASYALSLADLWYTALDIFDAEVEDWNAQGQLQSVADGESGQVTVAAQKPGGLQAGEEEYDAYEGEGREPGDGFRNGADERLQGANTSGLGVEHPAATYNTSASVLPAPSTFHAAGIAAMTTATRPEAEGTDASRVAHAGGAVGEDTLTLDFEGEEGGSSYIMGLGPAQHPQTTMLTTADVVTTILTRHAEEIVEAVENNRGLVSQDTVTLEDLDSINSEAVFETDMDPDGEDIFDLQRRPATAHPATPGNDARSMHIHNKISTEGGTVPMSESHTDEYTVTEHTSTLLSGSYERFQESVTQPSRTHEESAEGPITPPKPFHLEESITQDSGSANAKTDTFGVEYDQTIIFQKNTSTHSGVEFPCPNCLSNQCCHGPQSPLRRLPRDFMSAGVIGPFSWCGFVVYLSLSTLQPVPQGAIERRRPVLIERIQEFNEEIHEEFYEEFPPEDVGPLTLIAVERETTIAKTNITSEKKERRKKRDRKSGAEVLTKVTGTVIEGSSAGSSFTLTTTASTEPMLGVFQSREPKSTPFGPGATPSKWVGSAGLAPSFPGFTSWPDSRSAEMHKAVTIANSLDGKVDTDFGDRPGIVPEVIKVGEVTPTGGVAREQASATKLDEPPTTKNEPTGTGLGIIMEQQTTTSDKTVTADTKFGTRITEGEARSETVITQKATRTNKFGESPKLIAAGVPDSETGTIGRRGTTTTGDSEKPTQVQTTTIEETNTKGEILPKAPKIKEIEHKNSTTITKVIGETTRTVIIIPEIMSETKVTVVTESSEATEASISGVRKTPKVEGSDEIRWMGTGMSDGEIVGYGGTIETLPIAPKTIDIPVIERKNSTTTTVTEDTTLTVEHNIVIPVTGTETEKVTVVTKGDGHLQPTVGWSETAAAVSVTEATETEAWRRFSNFPTSDLAHEPDGEEGSIFVEDNQESSPVLNLSFTNESVQSFESFESSSALGLEDKTKRRSSRREKMMKALSNTIDAVKQPRLSRRRNKSPTNSFESAIETIPDTEDKDITDSSPPTSTRPRSGLAVTPSGIVPQMHQKLNHSGPADGRQSGSSILLERPTFQLQRAYSTGSTPSGTQTGGAENIFNRAEPLTPQSTTTTINSSTVRRSFDDSAFSYQIDSDNGSIETAPALTPGLGSESGNVTVGKRKIRKGKYPKVARDGTTIEASEPDDDTDSGGTKKSVADESEIHRQDHGIETQSKATINSYSTTMVHASNCQYFDSTGLGLVQCDCGGKDLITYQSPPPPEPTSTADLMAQLQSLLTQLQGRTGKVVVPRLGVNMTCEIAETEEEEVEVEVEVRVKYKSKKSMEHMGFCERTRGLLGAGGTCPIIEEMLGRA